MFFFPPKNSTLLLVAFGLSVLFCCVVWGLFCCCFCFPISFGSRLTATAKTPSWKRGTGTGALNHLCHYPPVRGDENTTFGTYVKKEECETWLHQLSPSKQLYPSCVQGRCYFFKLNLEMFTRVVLIQNYLLFCDRVKRSENLIMLVLRFDLRINQEDLSKYGYIFGLVNLFYIIFVANTKSCF